MNENIIIAIIGASGVVLAAVASLIGNFIKNKHQCGAKKKTHITQTAKGNKNIQIGIQNNSSTDKRRKHL